MTFTAKIPRTPILRGAGVFVAIGFCLLAAAAGATWLAPLAIDARSATRANAMFEAELDQRARQLKDAIALEQEGLMLAARNAVSNPRLMAAVEARVDKSTFDDIFRTELWWAPYRDELNVGIAFDGESLDYSQTDVVGALAWEELVRAARQDQTASGILRTTGNASKAPVAAFGVAISGNLMGQRSTAVLVFARAINDELCAKLSREPGMLVAVSDGTRLLARAKAPAGAPSLPIEGLIGQETLAKEELKSPLRARAVLFGTGLWLWVFSDVSAVVPAVDPEAVVTKRVLYIGAVGLALLGVMLVAYGTRGRRRHASPVPQVQSPAVTVPTPTRRPSGSSPALITAGTVEGELGRYTLVDRLGEGGMAEVFTAVSFGSGGFHRAFVVKRLRPAMRSCAEALTQFIDEANLAASLVHPNIVPVFDFGQAGDDYYLAQEYVPGRDLGKINRALIAAGEPPLSVEALLYVAHEILSALEYVHDRVNADGEPLGMVHRDVSPENILISERGEVKLLDFGIVKANNASRVSQTEVGHLKGNIDFMSPEQAQAKGVDRRSDLFSLGATIYKSIESDGLYSGDTIYDRVLAAALGPGPAQLAKIDAFPAPLCTLLRRALATNPDERFESAAAFRAAVPVPSAQARQELMSAVKRIFGEDLRAEQKRLAVALPHHDPNRATPSGEILLPAVDGSTPAGDHRNVAV